MLSPIIDPQRSVIGVAKVTLTFWNGFTSSDGDILREIVDRFNQLHVGEIEIQMDIIPWEVMFQRLPPAIATNTAPSFILMGYDTLGRICTGKCHPTAGRYLGNNRFEKG